MKIIHEYLNSTHNQVIDWCKNCDSKTSIAMAVVGVFVPVIFSNQTIYETIELIIDSVKNNKFCDFAVIDWIAVFVMIFLIVGVIAMLLSLVFQFASIFARINTTESNSKSLIFYGSISSIKLIEYSQLVHSMTEAEYNRDKIEQVHTCSEICTKKFKYYNRSIICLGIGIISVVIAYSFILIYNA